MTKRIGKVKRTEELLRAAMACAEDLGFLQVRRHHIAARGGVSEGLVSHDLGTMADIRRSIMRHAIIEHNHKVIAQGLACRDRFAMEAPEDLRQAAAQYLAQ